ncbi:AAA family ATPase [Chlorogloeopsis fritschii PCC 9212]|uniref:ATPase AAA n=1 Tax=Chlorogloeopsis fritschii PCC 6912 TaxID=211165 RepID=A0A3S0ZKA1_CHLFR|nr:ATP-binding protein [Chlorogloeopsis fritschii]RUR74463.1 ATPase AAA [Chlorogloeopsis fritschii PCC 6912]
MVIRLVPEASNLSLGDLLYALRRLDLLIAQAVATAPTVYGVEAATDAYRGLYISREEVERLLDREPGIPTLQVGEKALKQVSLKSISNSSRLGWLKDTFSLSEFDIDLIFIALAPEVDLRYERLYAYLQDDVTRKRPSVDLALNLLCSSAEAKLLHRAHFVSNAPLIRHRLIHLIPDTNQSQPPLLAHYLKLDEQIVRLLLEQEGLDLRLLPYCQMVKPSVSLDELPLNTTIKQALRSLTLQSWQTQQPLRLYFQGTDDIYQNLTAQALASEVGAKLVSANMTQLVAIKEDFEQIVLLLVREACLQRAILYLQGMDALCSDEKIFSYQNLLDELSHYAGIVVLAGTQPWISSGQDPNGVIAVPFTIPNFSERLACWQTHLHQADILLPEVALNTLADRFRLMPGQIAAAVVDASNRSRWRTAISNSDASKSSMLLGDLFSAARSQSGHDLAGLAHKIEPLYTWDDIILSDDARTQLQEMYQWVVHRHQVLQEWGFGRKLAYDRGVSALFAGPSGTGKTMSAEIIAKALGLDLYKINLSSVVSKYIGETEKNLERIFTAAENANAILFFDEADALFGKRSEVRDAHDRYANIEIAYLLQRMEQYEGITILATNLRQNIDDAFMRRLQFIIEFPFPDEERRRQIWEILIPKEAPQDEGIDYEFLARQFRFSGGNIKNIVLKAAFLAAAEGGCITMKYLVRATWRESQKIGQAIGKNDFGKYAEMLP